MRNTVLPLAALFFVGATIAEAQVPEVVSEACYSNVCLVEVGIQTPYGMGKAMGTGIYLGQSDGNYLVMTAAHVIRNGSSISCNFPGGGPHIQASVVDYDSNWDMAVLALSEPVNKPGVTMASRGSMIGDKVYAYGYPGGTDYRWIQGTTKKVVTNGRSEEHDWFEFDDAALQGMSGGPVFNEAGEYIGPLWGTDGVRTIATNAGRVQQFLWEFLGPLQQWRSNRLNGILNRAPDT